MILRIGVDASEAHDVTRELQTLLDALDKFRGSIFHRLVNHGVKHRLILGVGRRKSALRAGDNVVRLRVCKSLKVTVAALRALNIFDAHRILDGQLPPNVES